MAPVRIEGASPELIARVRALESHGYFVAEIANFFGFNRHGLAIFDSTYLPMLVIQLDKFEGPLSAAEHLIQAWDSVASPSVH